MKEKLIIGAFNDPNVSEENYKLFAESGLNFVIMNRRRPKEQIFEALAYAEKLGLSCIVNLQADESLLDCQELNNYKSFAGFHVFDEPIVDEFEGIKAKMELIAKQYPDKLFFVNLWPDQWDKNISKLHASDYPNYVDRFCFEVLSKLQGERVLSVDSYPLMYAYDGSGRDMLDGRHLETLELFARKAKEYNAIFHLYIQTMSYGKWHRKPTMEDMYFQFFVGMAYGAKRFSHFCYYTPGGSCADFAPKDYAMVAKNDEPTDIYHFVKQVNFDMQKFAEFILRSSWVQTAFLEGKTSFDEYEGKLYLRDRKDKLNGIERMESEYEAIVGEFDYYGEKAYVAVNFTNPCHKKTNSIKLHFVNCQKVCVQTVLGEETLALQDGVLHLSLDCGHGAVIRKL